VKTADVAIWRVPLEPSSAPQAGALAELSTDEHERAALFATDELRNRWLHGHVALRRILARHLGVAPERIVYGRSERGKPFLAPPHGALEFSFSDSGDLALVAVSEQGPVGVDVEACRPHRDLLTLAESFFAPEERAALWKAAESDRAPMFYRIWARKEAFIKAIGEGLAFGLERFAVTGDADRPRFVRIDRDPRAAGEWQVRDVSVAGGYAGALVAPAQLNTVEFVDWRP
jgi:4'-phosphopantetheinyl transferase